MLYHKDMNETEITTAARRITRETNRWTVNFQLRFDIDGKLIEVLPWGMYHPTETPYAVKTQGSKNSPWGRMTYRAAQELINIYIEYREEARTIEW